MNSMLYAHGQADSMDMVTLGERGQVVIPAAVREHLNLKAGDKLMAFTKHGDMICLVPASSMRRLVNVLNSQLADIEAGTDTNPEITKAKQEN